MNAVPLPVLCPDIPGAPRTETMSIARATHRFGYPVAPPDSNQPRLESPVILTDEYTALKLQLAAVHAELDRAREALSAELLVNERLLTRLIDDGDKTAKALKLARGEQRNSAAWERECVKLLLEVYKLKAALAERDADTVVVEVGP